MWEGVEEVALEGPGRLPPEPGEGAFEPVGGRAGLDFVLEVPVVVAPVPELHAAAAVVGEELEGQDPAVCVPGHGGYPAGIVRVREDEGRVVQAVGLQQPDFVVGGLVQPAARHHPAVGGQGDTRCEARELFALTDTTTCPVIN